MTPHQFKARPRQYEILTAMLCRDPVEAVQSPLYGGFFGGIGAGKSATGAHYAIAQVVNNPDTIGFIGSNTYQQLDQSTLKCFFGYVDMYEMKYVFGKQPPASWGIRSNFKEHNGVITFLSGTQVITRSLDTFDNIRGMEIGWFWLDETRDTKEKAWQVIKGRLRCKKSINRGGFISTTPNGFDWQYTEFVVKPGTMNKATGRLQNRDHIHVISATRENLKNLPPGYVESLEDSYDSFLAAQELEGQFVNTQSGRVYYAYSDVNNSNEIKYDPALPIYIGMDFNVDPMTAVLYQNRTTDKGLESHIFRVYYLRGSNTQLLGKKMAADYPQAVAFILTPCQSGNARQTVAPVGVNDIRLLETEFLHRPLRIARRSKNPLIRDRLAVTNNRLEKGLIKINPGGEGCNELISDWQLGYYKPGTSEPDWGGPLRGHACAGFDYSQEYHFRVERGTGEYNARG